jgi:hypothetical protein
MAAESNLSTPLSDLAAQFRRDGYVHAPGLLSANEIARLGAAVDHAVAVRKRDDHRQLSEKTPYEQSFIQCQYLWEDFPEVGGLTFHPAIGRLAAALVGAPRVRLWHDQALYKEAGGRETEAHQDQPYWPIAELDTVTAWIPLMAVDDDTGCMGYVPGSHLGEAHFVDIFTAPGAGQALLDSQTRDPAFVHCRPGDVIFHHGLTVHMAKPNRSDHTRRVYTAIYFADGSTRGSERPHPSVDRDGIAVGAVIDGRATPMVWPLPGGKAPEPAPWPQANDARRERHLKLGIIPGAR